MKACYAMFTAAQLAFLAAICAVLAGEKIYTWEIIIIAIIGFALAGLAHLQARALQILVAPRHARTPGPDDA